MTNQQPHVHILGIGGTFMAGLAVLAKQKGCRVTGSDMNIYPPMSTQLEHSGIEFIQGYNADQLGLKPDIIIVGNALSRGKYPVIEEMLNRKLSYISGPQWAAENILKNKYVIGVAGTHGKTTTSSMVSWILHYAGLNPGFLIGGIPENFGISASLGAGKYFIIEADEYDSAFFDKRSKFMHYHPDILILNNLEFDHADIFANLKAIQTQFEYLIRTVPGAGLIVRHYHDKNLRRVIKKNCWTPVETFGTSDKKTGKEFPDWCLGDSNSEGSEFEVKYQAKSQGKINWSLIGRHNQYNALAAIAAAYKAGVDIQTSLSALEAFKNVKRRLELLGEKNGVKIYTDFAHHPTAIQTTLEGLRAKAGKQAIIAVLECASNTMKMGIHKNRLPESLEQADKIIFLKPVPDWGIEKIGVSIKNKNKNKKPVYIIDNIDAIIEKLMSLLVLDNNIHSKTHIIFMSNGSFGGLPEKFLKYFTGF